MKAAAALYDEIEVIEPKRKYQVVRGLNNLGYSERRACRVSGPGSLDLLGHQVPPARQPRDPPPALGRRSSQISTPGPAAPMACCASRAALEIEQGIIVNKKLVWKMMRQLGPQGPAGAQEGLMEPGERRRPTRTSSSAGSPPGGPNELWLTDITEHPTREGKVYCCVVLRPVLTQGGGLGHRPALRCQLGQRRLDDGGRDEDHHRGHSDPLRPRVSNSRRGLSPENVRRLGLLGSMGTVGDCYDNAPMESFWGSMQIELLNRQKMEDGPRALDRHRRMDRNVLQPRSGATAPSTT